MCKYSIHIYEWTEPFSIPPPLQSPSKPHQHQNPWKIHHLSVHSSVTSTVSACSVSSMWQTCPLPSTAPFLEELEFFSHRAWCQRFMESPSEISTRGQSLSGALEDCEDVEGEELTTLMGVSGGTGVGPRLAGGQATVTVMPSGSGDQQLSDSQQPMTTVTRPMRRANIIYTSALPACGRRNITRWCFYLK